LSGAAGPGPRWWTAARVSAPAVRAVLAVRPVVEYRGVFVIFLSAGALAAVGKSQSVGG
jgi:hypothetical protein